MEATLQAAGLSVEVTEAADADPADAAALPPVHCAVARTEQIVASLWVSMALGNYMWC